jgi:hypothetical protein
MGAVAPPKLKGVPNEDSKLMDRGIYLSGPTAGDEQRFVNFVSLLDRTELKAVVLNVKDGPGKVWYETEVPLAHGTSAVEAVYSVHDRLQAREVSYICPIVILRNMRRGLQATKALPKSRARQSLRV